jgi:uncharacterized protein YegJ (DUF2314 family)
MWPLAVLWLIVASIGAILAGLWLRRAQRNHSGPAPAGIVLLLRAPRKLNAPLLAELLSKAIDRPIRALDLDGLDDTSDEHEPLGDAVIGKSPHFICLAGDAAFAVHNLPAPYMADPAQASESYPDLRLRPAIRDHKAWVAIDVVRPTPPSPEHYRAVARLAAGLVGSDCLALYHPPREAVVPYRGEETLAQLRSDDPIGALFEDAGGVPVIEVGEDPRMKAAESEAQRRFPEFEAAFQAGAGEGFSVKTAISRGEKLEHIWVVVDRIAGGRIEGRIGNDPVELEGLRYGSNVELKPEEVEDWAFARDGEGFGMFTVPVLTRIARERR